MSSKHVETVLRNYEETKNAKVYEQIQHQTREHSISLLRMILYNPSFRQAQAMEYVIHEKGMIPIRSPYPSWVRVLSYRIANPDGHPELTEKKEILVHLLHHLYRQAVSPSEKWQMLDDLATEEKNTALNQLARDIVGKRIDEATTN